MMVNWYKIWFRLIGGLIKKICNYIVDGDGILGFVFGKIGVYEKIDVFFNKKIINWICVLYLILIVSGLGVFVFLIFVVLSCIIG